MDVWEQEHTQNIESGWNIGQEDRAEAESQSSAEAWERNALQESTRSGPNSQQDSQSWDLFSEGSNYTVADSMLDNFDWQAYLAYYPDLLFSGINSESKAQQHYLEHGRLEGRVCKRLKVLLHYTACTGLINQHYSHIAAFTLSSAIGAELVLAPGLQRDSFASYFSTFKEQNEVTWTPTDISLMLDVDRITEEWRAHGMEVHKVRILIALSAR